ncbi:DUF1453 domain-containing protein [Novosphingobium soli]|uniref:DUF1453 domain-containing protein n=1 Tax=Novosphingobium soli TaxID=574956 RepID=A0ABV6CTS5_9SPHN
MGEGGRGLGAYLPFAVFAAIMAWRYFRMEKARPLRLPLLWIAPLLVTAAVCLALYGLPPSGFGWLALAAGFALGAGLGIQRSRLMRLHVEGAGNEARVMIRQSPLALLFILAIFAARRLFLPEMAVQGPHPAASGLLVMDATLGLMLGMVVLSRVVLWQRARAMVAAHMFDA